MPNPKLQQAVETALSDRTSIFGHYLMNSADVGKIIEIVMKELAVLARPECQQCIAELIEAATSGS